ncbi:hypothetical protein C1X29_03475 [Pseudomonas sp. GW456-12-10-14-LB2]|jgi:hypothetical protein|uniref:hypothetical protein n=1 Tax=unclassified Pseudomonas TaxID=196821 RepID=UPI000A1F915D|nr:MULTISPECIES: hypothetical protein [unclassified Pseudomonas]PNB51419.1 hypothetical protein C1X29_03475 [Pseudomonas sp. GW456-12-10-14-LB2]
MGTQSASSNAAANSFTYQIDSGEADKFFYANGYSGRDLEIYGARNDFEHQLEQIIFKFNPAIKSGQYSLGSPGVQVGVLTGWANIRYTPISMTLNLTVDHSSQHIYGVYDIQTKEDYAGGNNPGIRVNGLFDVEWSTTNSRSR